MHTSREKEVEEEKNASKRVRLSEANEMDNEESDVDETCQNNNSDNAVTIGEDSSCSQSSEPKGDDSSSSATAQNTVTTIASTSTSASQFKCKFCQTEFTNTSKL